MSLTGTRSSAEAFEKRVTAAEAATCSAPIQRLEGSKNTKHKAKEKADGERQRGGSGAGK